MQSIHAGELSETFGGVADIADDQLIGPESAVPTIESIGGGAGRSFCVFEHEHVAPEGGHALPSEISAAVPVVLDPLGRLHECQTRPAIPGITDARRPIESRVDPGSDPPGDRLGGE